MAGESFSTKRLHIFGFVIALLYCIQCASCSEPLPRGVSRAKGSFYKPGVPFTCLDGSQTIPFEQINDDYCDCADGTDEPGTSACRNGRFYCVNKGYKAETIPSSRVSDGVCDCCDGTDEYEAKANCQDTCIELGQTMREELMAMRRLVEEGHRIRSDYAIQGKQAKADKQELLVTLGPKREELSNRKDELQKKKDAVEEPEKAAKDVHESWWKEELAKKEAEREKIKASEAFSQMDTSLDQLITMVELQARNEFDKDKDLTVSVEEIVALIGEGVDNIDIDTFTMTVWPKIKDVYEFPVNDSPEPIEAPPTETKEAEPADDNDDDDSDFEEDDFNEEDDTDRDTDSSSDHPDDNLMPQYPEETLELIKVADAARSEFTDVDNEYNEVDKQITDIEKFLAQDMGPDDVFFPLRDQCYEYTDREYTYKFCPFDKASQRPKGGGTETSLGTFASWEANGDETYGFMKFEKGLHCWNGPDRSATVKFLCGKDNELSNGAEPNRCEYSFDFTTPAACHVLPEVDLDDPVHVHTEL